ncbi:YphA family membrane protein [Gottfriedia luciferensis]|uniref:YphA family membrane protein n=1 Tax=Gottfriedia luciferensis TaxID=178774 RepID=UPI000B43DD59|nr:hypothetical protein [Gottfriedia luciferensis]
MQGSIFIISSWVFVFIQLFSQKKSKMYFINLTGLLFLICCSVYTIELFKIEVNVAYLAMILIISYKLSLLGLIEQIGSFFKGLIIGMVYSIITMLAIYDPASFFINEMIIISFFILLLASFLSRSFNEQLRYVLIGLIQGEIFNYITFDSIKFNYIIGDLKWFDTLFFSIILLLGIKYLTIYFSKISIKNRKLVKN